MREARGNCPVCLLLNPALGSHSMLFAIVIRSRCWLRTRKIVNLIFCAHRYPKVVSNIRLRVNESCRKISTTSDSELSLSHVKSHIFLNGS